MSTLEPPATPSANGVTPPDAIPDFLERLRLPHFRHDHPPVKNANDEYQNSLSPLDKLAVGITDKVGSMGFFFIIMVWTILWTSYNILASEVPGLHWKSFDPFPAFVAYLLISNVIPDLSDAPDHGRTERAGPPHRDPRPARL